MPDTDKSKLIKTTVLFCYLFSGIVFSANAQQLTREYTYKHYTVQDGLAQMQVMSMFIDSKGYLWCSTKAGLSRFDGHRFKNFPNVILPGFDITVLGESDDGKLLLFGPDMMAELDGDTIRKHNYPAGTKSSSLYAHSMNHKQKLATRLLPNNKFYFSVMDYSQSDSLKLYDLNQKRGTVLFLEEGNRNYVWQNNHDTIYVSDVKTGDLIRRIYNPQNINKVLQHGNDFVGYNKQHEVFLISNGKTSPLFNIKETVRFFKIVSTPDNDALVVKTDQTLYLYKDELIPIKQNMTQIQDLVYDPEDNLWVSTEEGLYNFFHLNFQNFTFGMGNKDWVWSVIEGNDHSFWFASYQNGLWKWNGSTTTDYTAYLNTQLPKHLKRKPVPDQYRYYMGACKQGSALFFPTECNVLKYEDCQFSPVEGLPELPFEMTKVLPDGSLCCSGYPGLFIIDQNNSIKSWTREELGVSSILNFESDSNGNLVVIGKDGMSMIKADSIIHYESESLRHSYSLAKDHLENIWIAGMQNVNLLTGDSVERITTLDEEAFYSMLFVKPHYLFLGGIKGLYIADLDKYYSEGIFETILYNQSNGFTGIECGQNGFLSDSEGMVWIPTSDLVTRFDPQSLINKKIIPPRIFLNVSSSADNIRWQTEDVRDIEPLVYNRNNLHFQIDAVSFTNSGNIRYYYRLNGLQNEWSNATENNEISFFNLNPGKYIFEVKADAGVSQATSEIISMNFTIQNPLWKEWWFILTELIVLLLAVYLLVQYFRKREKNKAAIRQRLTQLRSEALSAQLDPHFVMNCLNNISGLVNAGYKKRANDYIVSFSKLLRVILQSVKKESISLYSEIEIVSKYMELEQFRCDHCFSFKIVLPENYSSEKIMVPPMMLQPLAENSIKHGFGGRKIENAHIEIQIKVEDKFLQISVRDNGKGLKEKSESLGTGLGTKITRERIELLQKGRNIQFEIRDRNPGAEVCFRIPLVIKSEEV